jgi:mannosyltransferase OCH1-like enzyme
MDPLVALSCFFGTEDGEHYSTGVIGAEPGHPAIRAYLDAVLTGDRLRTGLPANEATGPMFATSVLRSRDDVTLLPSDRFYPEPYEASLERRRLSTRRLAGPDTFVVHRWAHSWGDEPARRSRWSAFRRRG